MIFKLPRIFMSEQRKCTENPQATQPEPAKIMSLLQHMSARMRQMQKAYVDTCHALELCGDKEKLAAEHGDWVESHNRTYNLLRAMFPTLYHEEERKAQELCRAESDPQTAMLNTTAAERPQ